jgi:predicted lipid-binding transport protein (Tim44 family)
MGRRSRKRTGGEASAPATGESTRAERDEARRRRAQEAAARRRESDDPRLPAPWGPFPLTELVVLLAIGLLIGAFIVRGERGRTMLAAGLLLGSLGGLEVSIREHFAGYRSHTTIFAAAAGVLTIVVVTLVVHPIKLWIVALIALAMFCLVFYLAREAFKRRSGGVGFRAGR